MARNSPLSTGARLASWAGQLVAAAILAQTLFFKFSGAEESVYIFSTLGMEPWGRLGSGVAELIAVVLLLTPTLAAGGAVLGLGLMSGALLAHLSRLGIEVQGDGGLLFALGGITFAACTLVAVLRRGEIPLVGVRLSGPLGVKERRLS